MRNRKKKTYTWQRHFVFSYITINGASLAPLIVIYEKTKWRSFCRNEFVFVFDSVLCYSQLLSSWEEFIQIFFHLPLHWKFWGSLQKILLRESDLYLFFTKYMSTDFWQKYLSKIKNSCFESVVGKRLLFVTFASTLIKIEVSINCSRKSTY